MTPRLISTAEAKRYLGGRHPVSLGITPVDRELWDRRAIDTRLDQLSGLVRVVSGDPAISLVSPAAANDAAESDELKDLEKRIAASAPRRP